MRRIYKVEYEEKWKDCVNWVSGRVIVLANGDALAAVEKAKRRCLGQSYKDDEGKLQKCMGFRLQAINVITHVDI